MYIKNFTFVEEKGIFAKYSAPVQPYLPQVSLKEIESTMDENNPYSKFLYCDDLPLCKEYELIVPKDFSLHADDVQVMLQAQCDVLQIYCEGELVMDYLNNGAPMELGLAFFKKYIEAGKKLILKASPLDEDAKVYLQRNIKRGIVDLKIASVKPHFSQKAN